MAGLLALPADAEASALGVNKAEDMVMTFATAPDVHCMASSMPSTTILGLTPTSTPSGRLCTARRKVNCCAKDDMRSDQIAALSLGQTAELIAWNPDFTYRQFELQGRGPC